MLEDLLSGYYFARKETQSIQDDDFSNPGMLWVEKGSYLWLEKPQKTSKSCSDCHGNAESSMISIAPSYPLIDSSTGKLINIEQRIILCQIRHQKIKPFDPESDKLLSLSAYITKQSEGFPLAVKITGQAKPWFERGKKLYYEKVGQMDLACNQCHNDRVGLYLRAEYISQGHLNGFPAYLLRWGSLSSVHKRFQFCNQQARADPLEIFSDDYNALQLYVSWRGNGLPMESPAVRR